MLDYEGDDLEEIVCRTFTVDVKIGSETRTVELIPDGERTNVTQANKDDFV